MTQLGETRALAAASLAARAAEWTFALVAIPSVTGTRDEAAFAGRLHDIIAARPAFAARPQDVWTIPVGNDPMNRASVAALVRGTGERTVILTGHFDTVHVEDYGDLAGLAFHPHELKRALLERLAGEGANAAESSALADLRSRNFLPGRGLLDMKSGLAAGLAVLEAFAADPERRGNLLFLAVPDEEANSAGARSAAAALPQIAARLGLRFDAAINLDALVDAGDGEVGRSVALGTVGKLLPSALVVGQAVHASNSASGVNAGALAAAIVAEMEFAEALTDRAGEECAPPPTLLGLKDSRTVYDVTTPERVWAYWNVMLLGRGADDVLSTFARICRRAAAGALGGLTGRLEALGTTGWLPAEVPVLTFDELRGEVLAANPLEAERLASLARDVARRGLDLPEQCRILTDHLWTASRRSGPAIVVGFASLPYLPTTLSGAAGERLEAAARRAAETVAARMATTVSIRRTFPGISDMSHLGQANPAVLPVIAANTPAWGFGIEWPAGAGPAGIAVVNAGPWGRDYHTRLERLHTPYAFEVLPELLLAMVKDVLSRP